MKELNPRKRHKYGHCILYRQKKSKLKIWGLKYRSFRQILNNMSSNHSIQIENDPESQKGCKVPVEEVSEQAVS